MAVAVRARGIARTPSSRFQREVGLTGLMFASLGSIIGSGWLFGALYIGDLTAESELEREELAEPVGVH
jgi:hypothetical protein